jgi:hypothetical protein
VRVEEELKRKRAELLGEIEELTARIKTVNVQVSVIDQVIAIYDPAYAPERSAAAKPRRAKDARQLPRELARLKKGEAIFEVLREAGRPLSTSDCTCMIAEKAWRGSQRPGLAAVRDARIGGPELPDEAQPSTAGRHCGRS